MNTSSVKPALVQWLTEQLPAHRLYCLTRYDNSLELYGSEVYHRASRLGELRVGHNDSLAWVKVCCARTGEYGRQHIVQCELCDPDGQQRLLDGLVAIFRGQRDA